MSLFLNLVTQGIDVRTTQDNSDGGINIICTKGQYKFTYHICKQDIMSIKHDRDFADVFMHRLEQVIIDAFKINHDKHRYGLKSTYKQTRDEMVKCYNDGYTPGHIVCDEFTRENPSIDIKQKELLADMFMSNMDLMKYQKDMLRHWLINPPKPVKEEEEK